MSTSSSEIRPLAVLSAKLRAREGVRAAVVGAGASGRSAARLLRARGAAVTMLDDRQERLRDLPDGVRGRALEAAAVDEAELVVLSPGVPRARAELGAAVAGGRLVGEVELASWLVSVPLVGITGTNGKSTTTALVGHGLREAGCRAFVGGNLGTPLSELALSGEEVDVAVVEVSSFQLESVETARFRIGVWLNVQPDHLDRYPSFDAYVAAKARLFSRIEPGGLAVAFADDPRVAQAGRGAPRARWFGTDLQGRPGTSLEPAGGARRGEERYAIDGPGLLGPHNRENAAAAIEALRELGVSPPAVQAGLSSFTGLPHRLALVHEGGGVRWYDDSKATNVAAAATAVRAMERPTVLIAGGKDKGGSWAPLVEAARTGPVTQVLAIGASAATVEAAFRGTVPVEAVGTLGAAVARARALAEPGAAVLLAPACASFDQFASYAARGEAFARLARETGKGTGA
jgi:UDP-N-acetylmuramoylalanine--D-glutamate ligase